ncbi:site-2 protease family protein [Candidatus Saccharibacteria bacterium]|nr:site-2 protease family protein [Candidatus Saccharibacteria bacterium]
MLLALGLVLFVLLVVVHEYGHLIAAKRNGVEVEEFGIGFPPRAKVLTKNDGTTYTLNWLPLGGFVKMKGEHDAATEKGSFGAARFYQKLLIIGAGVLMNWLTAVVIFTILAFVGMPQLVENQFTVASDARVTQQEVFAGFVEEGSPAQKAGLAQGDKIESIAGQQITSSQQLRDTTTKFGGKEVAVTYYQDDVLVTKTVTLRNDAAKGNFGVAPAERTLVRSTWSALIVGIGTTIQFTVETFKGIGGALMNLFTGQGAKASASVTGPVGIIVVLRDLADQGLVFVLFLIGVISVSLAVMNSLPIPALDGGRLFVMGLFRIMRKPLTKDMEEKIHGTGMLVLLALAALITVVDVRRFF